MSLAKFLSILIRKFPPFFAWFVPQNFPQHQTSTALSGTCGRIRVTLVLPRSPVRFPTSTPKPRAEGSSPSAPAKKVRQTLILLRFDAFFCLYEPYEISLSPSKAAIREPIYDVIVVRHRVEKTGCS